MANCGYCGSLILFGGRRDGDARYCNDACFERGVLLSLGSKIPTAIVDKCVQDVYLGLCPRCRSSGPVEVYPSYRVWSAIAFTRWVNQLHVCCASCGRRAQILDLFISLLFGWWGFPTGLIVTPISIARNLKAMFTTHDPAQPSERLRKIVLIQMAHDAVQGSPDAAGVAPQR